MPFKCSVVNCRSGYSYGPSKVMFAFPKQDELRQKWVKILNREAFTVTQSSRILKKSISLPMHLRRG